MNSYNLDEFNYDDWICIDCGCPLDSEGYCPMCDPQPEWEDIMGEIEASEDYPDGRDYENPYPPEDDENRLVPPPDMSEIPF